jgi:hypothetical protein
MSLVELSPSQNPKAQFSINILSFPCVYDPAKEMNETRYQLVGSAAICVCLSTARHLSISTIPEEKPAAMAKLDPQGSNLG